MNKEELHELIDKTQPNICHIVAIQEVTIKHLLTMRAPYKCKGDPWSKVCSSDNWTYASHEFLC